MLRRVVLLVAMCIYLPLAAPGCGGSDESQADGCPESRAVPGSVTDVTATTCDEATALATEYFEDGEVPPSWTCVPYAGKLNGIQCFVGGCEPSDVVDPEVAQSLASAFVVRLDPETPESDYRLARNCHGS